MNSYENEVMRKNILPKSSSCTEAKIQEDVYHKEIGKNDSTSISTKKKSTFLKRYMERRTSNLETLINFVKGILETGILTMPKAFSNAGYVVGVIGLPVIAGISIYFKHVMLNSASELCKRKGVKLLTLKECVSAACFEGPKGLKKLSTLAGQAVEWVIFVNQIGVGVAFHVFIADNIKSVCDEYLGDYDIRIYISLVYVPLVLVSMLRDLKILVPFSLFANIVSFTCFGIILYYVFSNVNTLEDKRMVGDAANFPLFICTAMFSAEVINMIFSIQNKMKNPQDLGGSFGVFNQSMLIILTLYTIMGFFGYMAYGATVKDTITLNMPQTKLSQSVRVMYPIAIIISYGLQVYISMDILWNGYLAKYFQKHRYQLIMEYLVRIALVTITLILGVAISKLELVISLVGAVSFSSLGLVLPPLVELFTFWHHVTGHSFYLMAIKDTLFILLGFAVVVLGTYTSLANIINSF